jgi:hypothetical protein
MAERIVFNLEQEQEQPKSALEEERERHRQRWADEDVKRDSGVLHFHVEAARYLQWLLIGLH